jgi:hypothetical protein
MPGKDPGDWDNDFWTRAETLNVGHFRPEGSEHQPLTRARLLWDADGIHGIFQVHDRFVRCLRTRYHEEVWKDSCVEFFAEPKPGRGYFNFEFNCGGAFLCNHITNPERTAACFKEFTKLPESLGSQIRAWPSLPRRIDVEIEEPLVWSLRFFIPFAILEPYVGPLGPFAGQTWRGNFFKCADESSHPHWASWAPVSELNFHLPACFGTLQFGNVNDNRLG